MKIIKTVNELREQLKGLANVGFVPTMGALHKGHVSLVERAIEMCDTVVVSVFVNPTQFNDATDLQRYPRNLQADALLLESAGADFLFAPSVDEIYPSGNADPYVIKDETLLSLTSVMEGARRPGHFDGVVQVVGRLFDIVEPDKAFFGEKDFQQLAIIRAMTKLQDRDIEIIGCEIVRAQSGLARSSRNSLLTEDQKRCAANIYKSLKALRANIESGGDIEAAVKNAVLDIDKIEYLCTEYISVVDAATLAPYSGKGKMRICAAVQCGSVRLIDNL